MDAEAFDRYFTARYPVLVGHVTAMWGDPDAAADAVQEAFVRAWSKRREFGRHPHPDAWIRTVADLPVARVAEELDAQPGTVRVWLSRGRVRLGVLLDEDKEPRHA